MNKLLKNQKGLIAIAAAILIVGAFMVFGKTDRANESGTALTDTEEKQESTEGSASQQVQPKSSDPKPMTSTTPVPSTPGLNGYTFRLTAYNGIVIPNGDIYTVTFKAGNPTFEDGFITAKFCNTLTGSYRIKNGVINGGISGTRMTCTEPKDVMNLEGAFGVLIDGGSKLTLEGNALTLSDNVKTMVFVRQ
jgi:hypothetical protein